jgi:glycopeptide antibiotics resistance protein
MPSPPAAQLARAVLAYLILMIAIITLAPFRFASTPVHGLNPLWSVRDLVLNVVLFVPIGFVFQLGRARGSAAAWVPALLLGAAVSAAVEVAQLFAPLRFPSLADLATNALGAVLGAVVAARATRSLEGAGTVRAFALDLPLVGLVYLLVPILWLGGLSSAPSEALLLLFPVGSAAWIIASVQRAYVRRDSTARPLLQPAMAGALFVAVGFVPAMPNAPEVALAAALVFTAVALLRGVAPEWLTHGRAADGTRSRRFEAPTLRVALVPVVLFVILHALWPLDAPRTAWRGTWALLPLGTEADDRTIFRVMAHASAFTVLGYGIAEHAARATASLRRLLPRVLAWSAALAAPIELLRGWRAGSTASAAVLAISVTAALFGAWLFQLQLRHLKSLLGREQRRGVGTQPDGEVTRPR